MAGNIENPGDLTVVYAEQFIQKHKIFEKQEKRDNILFFSTSYLQKFTTNKFFIIWLNEKHVSATIFVQRFEDKIQRK